MRALVFHKPKDVRVEHRDDPKIQDPRDAIIRVTSTAICGSDLHMYNGTFPQVRPMVLGHEFMGIVEEVGKDVANLKKGDRVVVPFPVACGTCWFCNRDLQVHCENSNPKHYGPEGGVLVGKGGGLFGYTDLYGGYDGGQAELVRVPFADVGPMKIPDDMHEEDVLFLTDILPTGYQAAEMGDIKEGESVVIFGAGPVGLMAAKSAWLQGAGRVIVVDEVDYRLDLARSWASAETIDFTDHHKHGIVGYLKEITDGRRGPDVCIDAVGCEASGSFLQKALGMSMLQAGAATALMWAIQSVRRGGNVVAIGVYGPPWNLVPLGEAMNKGLTLRAAQCNVKRYLPRLLEHIRAGRIDPKGIISHRVPLEDAPEAYRIFARKEDRCTKCVLVPKAA